MKEKPRTIFDLSEATGTTPEELLRMANRYYNAVNIDDPCVISQYIGYWDIVNMLEATTNFRFD